MKAIYKSLKKSEGKIPKAISNNINKNFSRGKEPPGVLWWTAKCQELISNRREALKNFKENASVENFDSM